MELIMSVEAPIHKLNSRMNRKRLCDAKFEAVPTCVSSAIEQDTGRISVMHELWRYGDVIIASLNLTHNSKPNVTNVHVGLASARTMVAMTVTDVGGRDTGRISVTRVFRINGGSSSFSSCWCGAAFWDH